MKNTVITFREAKGREKLSVLTAYDYSTARLMDQENINALLVGDSLGMVMLGHADTLSVTLEDMIRHCAAVARGSREALVICDMPFMSYQISVAETLRNAGRLMKEGRAQAVKLEGGANFCPQVRALVQASIPVMGHLGLTPQSVHALGGYKVQGQEPGGRPRNCWTTPALLKRPEPFPWCWSACPRPWPPGSPRRFPFRPSASGRDLAATGRYWSGRTCWAFAIRFHRNSSSASAR